jgi:hypothetical protein
MDSPKWGSGSSSWQASRWVRPAQPTWCGSHSSGPRKRPARRRVDPFPASAGSSCRMLPTLASFEPSAQSILFICLRLDGAGERAVKLKTLALALGSVLALLGGSALAARMLAPTAVVGILHSKGFRPISRPTPHGLNYEVRALDSRGVPVRVLVDARFGEVLSVRPTSGPSPAGTPRSGMAVPSLGQPRATVVRPPARLGGQRPPIGVPGSPSAPPAESGRNIAAPAMRSAAGSNPSNPHASPAQSGDSSTGGVTGFPPVTPLE